MANESVFFKNELEHVKAKSYDVLYGNLGARIHIPMSTDSPEWAETVTYYQYDMRGSAKWLASYADDIPRCDVVAKKFSVNPKAFGASYGWNVDEIAASAALGKRLDFRKGTATATAFRQFENNVAWFAKGDVASAGTVGLLYNSNIPVANAPTGTWSTATPDQIIADVGFALNTPITLTKGREIPDTLLMGLSSFTKVSTTRCTDTNVTILAFLRESYPGVTFGGIPELDAVSPKPSTPTVVGSSTNVLLAYDKNVDKLSLEVVRDYTVESPDKRNLEYVINTHGKTGGVFIYYPLSLHIVENV